MGRDEKAIGGSGDKADFKCGNVALLGEANVGKSSIVNYLVGEKLSIVADHAGTTRVAVRGVKTTDDYQIIFIDTPGMQKRRNELERQMTKQISGAVRSADVVLYTLDATDIKPEHIKKIKNYESHDVAVVVAVNKSDKTTMQKLYPVLGSLNELTYVRAIVPVSAKTGFNMGILEAEIVKLLPVGVAEFAEDDFTDQTVRNMAAEVIRGAIINRMRAEIPTGIAVKITEWKEADREIDISANIIVDRESHKPMVIGKRGHVLKEAGTVARTEISKITGKHIRIFTHVYVREGWRDKGSLINEYSIPETK